MERGQHFGGSSGDSKFEGVIASATIRFLGGFFGGSTRNSSDIRPPRSARQIRITTDRDVVGKAQASARYGSGTESQFLSGVRWTW